MPTIEQTSEWARVVLPVVNDVVHPHEFAEITKLTADVSSQRQRWSDGEPADPMVIAAAEVLNCAVISGESPRIEDRYDPKPISGNGEIRNESDLYSSWIRIPDICLIRGIQHLKLLSFFRSQGWSF